MRDLGDRKNLCNYYLPLEPIGCNCPCRNYTDVYYNTFYIVFGQKYKTVDWLELCDREICSRRRLKILLSLLDIEKLH